MIGIGLTSVKSLLKYNHSSFNTGVMSVDKLGLCHICNVKLVSNLNTLLPRSVNVSLCE